MIHVGILGFGLSGRYLQAPFFRAHPGFCVQRVLTSRAAELAADFLDLTPTADAEAIFADPQIDLVSVATPNATHYAYVRAALEAGKHVLVEKPACPTAAELRELRDLAQRKGRQLFVFQNRRWDSDFLTIRSLLAADRLGPLVHYEARFDRWKPAPNAKAWKETPDPGVGMIYDLGAHILDQAIALFGRPQNVTGRSWIQRSFSTVPDAFDLQLDYNRLRVSLSGSLLVREPTPRYLLHGERGSFRKYGIDVQEDQLRSGTLPTAADFGREPTEQDGLLHTEVDGLVFRGQLRTQPGRWMDLFENIHDVIVGQAAPAVTLEEVITQLEIIESVGGPGRDLG
jgi:predicted dehydrogenase